MTKTQSFRSCALTSAAMSVCHAFWLETIEDVFRLRRAAVAVGIVCSVAGSWPVTAFAQSEFDVGVSDTTVTRYERAKDQFDPLHTVRKKALEEMAMTGTLVLALIPGVGPAYVATVKRLETVVAELCTSWTLCRQRQQLSTP